MLRLVTSSRADRLRKLDREISNVILCLLPFNEMAASSSRRAFPHFSLETSITEKPPVEPRLAPRSVPLSFLELFRLARPISRPPLRGEVVVMPHPALPTRAAQAWLTRKGCLTVAFLLLGGGSRGASRSKVEGTDVVSDCHSLRRRFSVYWPCSKALLSVVNVSCVRPVWIGGLSKELLRLGSVEMGRLTASATAPTVIER